MTQKNKERGAILDAKRSTMFFQANCDKDGEHVDHRPHISDDTKQVVCRFVYRVSSEHMNVFIPWPQATIAPDHHLVL